VKATVFENLVANEKNCTTRPYRGSFENTVPGSESYLVQALQNYLLTLAGRRPRLRTSSIGGSGHYYMPKVLCSPRLKEACNVLAKRKRPDCAKRKGWAKAERLSVPAGRSTLWAKRDELRFPKIRSPAMRRASLRENHTFRSRGVWLSSVQKAGRPYLRMWDMVSLMKFSSTSGTACMYGARIWACFITPKGVPLGKYSSVKPMRLLCRWHGSRPAALAATAAVRINSVFVRGLKRLFAR
jgi:hypothetical protein